MTMLPPPPASTLVFVAILDLLGFKATLCDDSGVSRPRGLEELYETYFKLLWAKDLSTRINNFELGQDKNIRHVSGRINNVVASDTVLLWASDDEAEYFVDVVAELVNFALTIDIPLRGAISYGNCIIEKGKNIFLGLPIVEALEAEKIQEWIGIAVLQKAVDKIPNHPRVVEYCVPVKPDTSNLNHALLWHWAENTPNAPEIRLKRLMNMASEKDKLKYENALAFVAEFASD